MNIDDLPVRFTKHALARILDMALDAEEVKAVLEWPERRGWSPTYKSDLWSAGRVTLAINPDTSPPTVITAVWATEDDWRKDYETAPMPHGREPRTQIFAPTQRPSS